MKFETGEPRPRNLMAAESNTNSTYCSQAANFVRNVGLSLRAEQAALLETEMETECGV